MVQKLLLAGEDRKILTGYSDILRFYGFETAFAATAAKFHDLFLRFAPDLLIMDVYFGAESGPDVYDRVMKAAGSPQTPVIFLSAKLDGTHESPLVRGRQVAMYFKPLSAHRIATDIRLAFAASGMTEPA